MPPKVKKPATSAAAPGALAAKERALFTRLIQEYEGKKYKLGLKTADTILKKYPDHGETLCMKGLILGSIGKRAEGLDLAKQGVRKDLMSFISWHALGILNRMDKQYDEAIKCYSQALRIEGGTNINLIRESTYMHMQSRNYQALIDGRVTLLRTQPHIRSNWAALATAYHLAGELDEAAKILEQWQASCRDVPPRNYEHSEMILYRASILLEAQRFNDTIDCLRAGDAQIVDKRAARILTAQALLGLGNLEESESIWRALLRDNEEDKDFVAGWIRSQGAKLEPQSQQEREETLRALGELESLFPKSQATKRLQLAYASGPFFAENLEAYLSRALTKGIPSIFSDLKSLLTHQDKREEIENCALRLLGLFAPTTSSDEPPSSYLWTLYFLAQYYSQVGHAETALKFIESAIAHTPTLPELHMTKARILKRAGAIEAASHAMEDARLLDGQDRFLNSKDAKYKLRAGRVEEAEAVMGMFTKPDAASPLADLLEMQALWFILEEGLSHEVQGTRNLALKRYSQLEALFQDHWDDQLDFHSYCIRKFALRDYVAMCRWEDQVHSHPASIEACLRSADLYLALYDESKASPSADGQAAGDAGQVNGNASDEAKKEAKRLKKQQAKQREEQENRAKEAAAKSTKSSANTEEDDLVQPPPDPDPEGLELVGCTEPLKEVERLVRKLQQHAPMDARTWLTTYEFALRDRNWLLCARALRKSHEILLARPNLTQASRLHVQRLQLFALMPDLSNAPDAVRHGIEAALALPGLSRPPVDEVTLDRLNDDYLQQSADTVGWATARLVLSAASSPDRRRADSATEQEVVMALVQLPSSAQASKPSLSTLTAVLQILKGASPTSSSAPRLSCPATSEQLESFCAAAHKLLPLSETFCSPEVREKRAKDRRAARSNWEARQDGEDGSPA
ncbi:unnamed protein product [Jaminaea pallidilutea]